MDLLSQLEVLLYAHVQQGKVRQPTSVPARLEEDRRALGDVRDLGGHTCLADDVCVVPILEVRGAHEARRQLVHPLYLRGRPDVELEATVPGHEVDWLLAAGAELHACSLEDARAATAR